MAEHGNGAADRTPGAVRAGSPSCCWRCRARVNAQMDATQAELLPEVRRALGRRGARRVDLTGLVNTRITGLSVVVTPEAVATVLPLSAASVATTRAGRRAVTDIVGGADDRLAVIAGPCSIHDPAAALEYAAFIARMRERHGDATSRS